MNSNTPLTGIVGSTWLNNRNLKRIFNTPHWVGSIIIRTKKRLNSEAWRIDIAGLPNILAGFKGWFQRGFKSLAYWNGMNTTCIFDDGKLIVNDTVIG